jgi:hypothetical protein
MPTADFSKSVVDEPMCLCSCVFYEPWDRARGAGDVGVTGTAAVSAWKSSLRTAKRPGLDRTQTSQDRKFPRPSKTATAVQSSVSQDFGNFKTNEKPVLTGLNQSFDPKPYLIIIFM